MVHYAYYADSIAAFLEASPHTILGSLTKAHPFDLNTHQTNSWLFQIELLQRELAQLGGGWIAFEFIIPRMGKRVDAIIIVAGVIFVVEFKVGSDKFFSYARDQVIDYALDLKNFHAGSHHRHVVPILIATGTAPTKTTLVWNRDAVAQLFQSNGSDLCGIITSVLNGTPKQQPLDGAEWAKSGYKPTPTIIEAAQALYRGHRVEEITRSDAGARNLSETAGCIGAIIDDAKAHHRKAICFVTGVPGAGKTLAGLNLVTERTKAHKDEHAVFLSGNGPLVEVLREALARDEQLQGKEKGIAVRKSDAVRKVKSFIQNIHHFRDANLTSNKPTVERVAVFDEAQRAWDEKQTTKFMTQKRRMPNFKMSEPEFLISIMDRQKDWCTIVCLVGGGQEINSGEAGLTEWFAALKKRFHNWTIYTSPVLNHRDYHWGRNLSTFLDGLSAQSVPALHLSVSVRSFRAEKLSEFVGAVIAGESDVAKALYNEIKAAYPVALTRNLNQAKAWLRAHARGSERFGLVASSGASRLKPEGLNVHEKISATHWFLNQKTDVRSSYYLEDPATEFDIQGLELDWVGVCWDADFRRTNGLWSHHNFSGTVWKNVADEFQKSYLANAYRVLLTRARQGMVIYVPKGDASDPTRLPHYYDGVAKFLESCGLGT